MSEVINLRNLNSRLADDYDVFICSASFEERCLLISQKVKRKEFSKVIVVENENGSKVIQDKADKLCNLFPKSHLRIRINFHDSLNIADKISKELSNTKAGKVDVLMDITTFTHEVLMICLKLLKDIQKVRRVTCVYVNASEYCPGQPVEKKWLSHGCKEVHSILGYPGMLEPSRKTHLVIIVGYEYNRAFDVITCMEPNSISLVYGTSDSAMTEKDKNANAVFKELVEEMAFEYSFIDSLSIPCNDPIATSNELHKIYKKYYDHNILVVPMNSKMSTIGVALSIMESKNVQACYAPAILYNENNYSSAGNRCHIYEFKQ